MSTTPRQRRPVATGIGLFVIVLLSLQIFLLTIGLDALLADDASLAWVSAASSVVLASGSVLLYLYVRER